MALINRQYRDFKNAAFTFGSKFDICCVCHSATSQKRVLKFALPSYAATGIICEDCLKEASKTIGDDDES